MAISQGSGKAVTMIHRHSALHSANCTHSTAKLAAGRTWTHCYPFHDSNAFKEQHWGWRCSSVAECWPCMLGATGSMPSTTPSRTALPFLPIPAGSNLPFLPTGFLSCAHFMLQFNCTVAILFTFPEAGTWADFCTLNLHLPWSMKCCSCGLSFTSLLTSVVTHGLIVHLGLISLEMCIQVPSLY